MQETDGKEGESKYPCCICCGTIERFSVEQPVWNCHRLMVHTECGPAAELVLQGIAWLFTSLSLLCFLFQVLFHMLP